MINGKIWKQKIFAKYGHYFKGKATMNQNINLPISSNLQAVVVEGEVSQKIRQHMWFFVLDNCGQNVFSKFEDKYTRNIKMRVIIEILNEGKSQFSSVESGIIYYIGILSIVVTYLFIKNYRLIVRNYKKEQEMDYALLSLLIVIGIEVIQNYFYLIHLIIYQNNGQGVAALLLLSEIFQVCYMAISRFCITTLMILISWGWTINYIELESFDIYLPLGLVIGYLEILAMALGKITDDSHNKYHHFDGWIGVVICFIEIGMYIYFYFGIRDTIQKAGQNVRMFANQLKLYSTFYFWSFPAFLIISKILAAYLRFKFILIGTSLSRLIIILLFIGLFTNRNSEYGRISYINQSPLDRIKRE